MTTLSTLQTEGQFQDSAQRQRLPYRLRLLCRQQPACLAFDSVLESLEWTGQEQILSDQLR